MKKTDQAGFSIVEALLILVVVSILGFTGWFVYHAKQTSDKNYSATNSSTVPTHKKNTTTKAVATTDPYAGWKTYTSSFEKLSFKYPADWKSYTPAASSNDPNADSFAIESTSGAVDVSWISEVDGIGGACNANIMPGTTVSSDQPSACPYWTVLNKQKLSGANLYYVDGVVTHDGTDYSPWCALQDASGIVQSQSNIGYLVFKGKNNDVIENGHNNGPQDAALLCGKPFDGAGVMWGTKAAATAALASADFQQAKQILLSATY